MILSRSDKRTPIDFKLLVLLVGLFWPYAASGQDVPMEELQQQLATATSDTTRVNRLLALSDQANNDDYVSALQYGEQALALATRIKYGRGRAQAQFNLGRTYSNLNNYEKAVELLAEASSSFGNLGDSLAVGRTLSRLGWVNVQRGDYATAFELEQEALRIAQEKNDKALHRQVISHFGALHTMLGDFGLALDYLTSAMDMYDEADEPRNVCRTLNALGELYRLQGDYGKAQGFYEKAIRMAEALENNQLQAQAECNLAAVYIEIRQPQEAIKLAHRALRVLLARGEYEVIAFTQTVLGRAHLRVNRPDSAIFYGQKGWNLSREIGFKEVVRDASDLLAKAYAQQGNYKQAYNFQQINMAYTDTLLGAQTRQQLSVLQQNAEAAEKQAEAAVQAEESRRRQIVFNAVLSGLIVVALVAYILYRNNRQKQRSNALLQQQRDELEKQRDQTSRALADLQAAQTQLIQQEKLASLGELTAGIAHEIQNPLNFVNNFSEVSAELIAELQEERQKGDQRDQELEVELLEDLTQNLQKITHHGQRASGIVKSMLAHSRKGSTQKEPTDLNALADEYLRLSYHGLRAKDKTFNCTLNTNFAPDLPKVSVISQDIGRVLLNLYNNAFYAVQQQSKNLTGLDDRPTLRLQGLPGYQPTVTVTTQCLDGRVRISVADNGMGMPDEVKAKIFQPFFTTKPTGEGTGLGLSLSYDIITKGHGGTMTVESREGEGAVFIIELPFS